MGPNHSCKIQWRHIACVFIEQHRREYYFFFPEAYIACVFIYIIYIERDVYMIVVLPQPYGVSMLGVGGENPDWSCLDPKVNGGAPTVNDRSSKF